MAVAGRRSGLKLWFIDEADHFLTGHEDELRQNIEKWISAFLAGNLAGNLA
jgi:alpha/beta superfamily hydrolase